MIALSILLISALITLTTGALYGTLEAIKIKAGRYFAGTTSITGYDNSVPFIRAPEAIIQYLQKTQLPIQTIAARTTYYDDNAVLFFNGETIRQRKLIGIDFASEGVEFQTLAFQEGSWESLASESEDFGILISVPAARLLGCRVGDDITLTITTASGQYNTARLIVRGIFDEASLFGFVAYMRREDLNRLLGQDFGVATDIAVYTKEGIDGERFSEEVRRTLSANFDVFPRFYSRDERDTAISASEMGKEKYAVLSQNAQLADIKRLLDALRTVAYFVLAVFIGIVMVGILNTYRVLVNERTKEIGTLRAIGMGRTLVCTLFLTEAVLLALLSSCSGLAFGILLFRVFSLVDLSSIPAAGMLLEKGHIRFSLNPSVLLVNTGIMVAAALFAAWGPSRQASHVEPADALRSIW